MKRKIAVPLAALALLAVLCACGGGEEAARPAPAAAQPDPDPPVEENAARLEPFSGEPAPAVTPDGAWAANSGAAADEPSGQTEEAAVTPAPTPTPAPTAVPEPTPVPLRPGTYEGSDGSVLEVKEDGTCAYETEISGTVNGAPMTGRITFHGTVEGGRFSFTKVTYLGLDVTGVAAASGYEDASYWERAAAIIYAGGIG